MNTTLVKRVVAILGLCLCLGLMNWNILEKERHLTTGQVVLLKLAPVDPRSLMQGDFMALRYAMESPIRSAVLPAKNSTNVGVDGLAWVTLTKDNIAQLAQVTLSSAPPPAEARNLTRLKFRMRGSKVKLGTNAFFFQEGTGPTYEAAEYGKFRVSDNGELLLTHLVDKNLDTINPPTNE